MKQTKEKAPDIVAEKSNESLDFQIADMADIEHMPENTLTEIRSKETAFNNHILALDRVIPLIKSNSGENAEKNEEAGDLSTDMQLVNKLLEDMRRARREMARLVDKIELLKEQQKAA
jgi:hypothetical protein